jgi:hypothetical protein
VSAPPRDQVPPIEALTLLLYPPTSSNRPILDERITPYVREHFPETCNKDPESACTPCYSLVRRYRPGERRSHETHRDGHALVTVVVSLSDYGSEYRGGIYVAHNRADKKVLALKRGDAVVHQSDLLHGVKVKDDGGERWSWVLWFKDSTECHDSNNVEWFRECADKGSAVCQAQVLLLIHLLSLLLLLLLLGNLPLLQCPSHPLPSPASFRTNSTS